MHNLLVQTIFYIFASIAIISALMAICQNNPVRCVLFLVLTFLSTSILWMLVEAEFLALILVLVYVGAVMTLFLFIVMMLNIDLETVKSNLVRYLPFGLIIIALLTSLLMVAIPADIFKENKKIQLANNLSRTFISDTTVYSKEKISNTEALGEVLYTDYLLAFEMAAVILLVAIISAITLVHRPGQHSKRQNIKKQIMTQAKDRIQLINLKK